MQQRTPGAVVTNKTRLTLGVAFAVVVPVPMSIFAYAFVGTLSRDLWYGRLIDGLSLLLVPMVWLYLLAVSTLAMALLGLPAWLILHRLQATWMAAACCGALVGGITAAILIGRAPNLWVSLTLMTFGAAIGAVAAGGAWLITYRRRKVSEVVDTF